MLVCCDRWFWLKYIKENSTSPRYIVRKRGPSQTPGKGLGVGQESSGHVPRAPGRGVINTQPRPSLCLAFREAHWRSASHLCFLTQGRLNNLYFRYQRMDAHWNRALGPNGLSVHQWSSMLLCAPSWSQTLRFQGRCYHHCFVSDAAASWESGLAGYPSSRSHWEVDRGLESQISVKAHAVFIIQHGLA